MAEEIRAAVRLADSGETPAARTVTRLIVLPFRMLRPDPEIDFLSFSLADAITASLGSLESLVVRSSLAAARFKADAPDLAALASELDVDVAVTGTLLRAGTEVRVATQLVEVQSGRLLWSQDDAGDAQRHLSAPGRSHAPDRRIAGAAALRARAADAVARRAGDRPVLRILPARQRARSRIRRAGGSRAICTSRRSRKIRVMRRPGRGSVVCSGCIGKLGGGTDEDLVRAEAAVRRALELNPDLPLAHNLTAQIDIDRGRARDAMVRLTRPGRAAQHGPGAVCRARLRLPLLRSARRVAASGRAGAPARSLDQDLGHPHALDAAQPRRAWSRAPSKLPVVAFSLVALGREQDALVLLAEKDKNVPPKIRQIIGALRRCSKVGARRRSPRFRPCAPDFRDAEGLYYLARQLAYAGAADDAMRLLERATAAGFWCYPLLASDAWLDPLRDRPDFVAVLGRAEQEHDLAVAAFAAAGGAADPARSFDFSAPHGASSHTTASVASSRSSRLRGHRNRTTLTTRRSRPGVRSKLRRYRDYIATQLNVAAGAQQPRNA